MESIEIDKATKYLQEFDHYPEYQRKLDLLVKAYYAEIDIINSLMFHVRTQKKDQ